MGPESLHFKEEQVMLTLLSVDHILSSKNLTRGVWGERGRYKDVHGTAPALKKVILVGKVKTSTQVTIL